MPFIDTSEERRVRLESIPPDNDLVLETKAYIGAAHLSTVQFAQYIGYGASTVRHWLAGRYHHIGGSDKNIRKTIRTFLDANPIASAQEVEGRFYDTENVATMRFWFDYCLGLHKNRGRMVCIYSGPGGQKTFIAEHLVAEFNRRHIAEAQGRTRPRAFYVYCSQNITPPQLVEKLLEAAGLPRAASMQSNLASLRYHLRGTRTIFLVDEAQHLSLPCLEIVRELNDLRPKFGVMILGSHNLRITLDSRAAEMEQWHSRVKKSIELPGISDQTARLIVREELAGITHVSESRLDYILGKCMVDDAYSREKVRYLSARKLFDTIEEVRDEVLAASASTGGVN